MTSALSHPLVSAYLHDLELLLRGVEPGERAEVLGGVHEHLDASLAPGASDDDVHAILAELGSPQSVADEAYAGRVAPAASSPSVARPRPGFLSRGWVPVVVGLGLGFALVLIILIVAASTGYSTTSATSSDSLGMFGSASETIQYDLGAFPSAALMSLLATTPVWFVPLFLNLASPLWTARQKTAGVLILPIAASALTALPDLGWALTKAELGINLGSGAGLAIALLGGGYVILRTTRTGIRRAEALGAGAQS